MKQGAIVLGLLFAIASCDDTRLLEPTHASTVTNEAFVGQYLADGFRWLPPIGEDPQDEPSFDPNLRPTVTICKWSNDTCLMPFLAEFTFVADDTNNSATLRLDTDDGHYIVNWHTNDYNIDDTATYLVAVSVSGVLLGSMQVTFDENAEAGPQRYRALRGTIPIKFAIHENTVQMPLLILAGPGVTVAPTRGLSLRSFNESIDYAVITADGYDNVTVALDGHLADTQGTFTMDKPHVLQVTAAPAVSMPPGSERLAETMLALLTPDATLLDFEAFQRQLIDLFTTMPFQEAHTHFRMTHDAALRAVPNAPQYLERLGDLLAGTLVAEPTANTAGTSQLQGLTSLVESTGPNNTTTIIYVNGMNTDPTEAEANRVAIDALVASIPGMTDSRVNTTLSYNQTGNITVPILRAPLEDIAQVVRQTIEALRGSWGPDIDVDNVRGAVFKELDAGHNVLLLAHSQGNFIGQRAVSSFLPECMRAISVAAPNRQSAWWEISPDVVVEGMIIEDEVAADILVYIGLVETLANVLLPLPPFENDFERYTTQQSAAENERLKALFDVVVEVEAVRFGPGAVNVLYDTALADFLRELWNSGWKLHSLDNSYLESTSTRNRMEEMIVAGVEGLEAACQLTLTVEGPDELQVGGEEQFNAYVAVQEQPMRSERATVAWSSPEDGDVIELTALPPEDDTQPLPFYQPVAVRGLREGVATVVAQAGGVEVRREVVVRSLAGSDPPMHIELNPRQLTFGGGDGPGGIISIVVRDQDGNPWPECLPLEATMSPDVGFLEPIVCNEFVPGVATYLPVGVQVPCAIVPASAPGGCKGTIVIEVTYEDASGIVLGYAEGNPDPGPIQGGDDGSGGGGSDGGDDPNSDDDDGDGVADEADECPATAVGAGVDADGCSLIAGFKLDAIGACPAGPSCVLKAGEYVHLVVAPLNSVGVPVEHNRGWTFQSVWDPASRGVAVQTKRDGVTVVGSTAGEATVHLTVGVSGQPELRQEYTIKISVTGFSLAFREAFGSVELRDLSGHNSGGVESAVMHAWIGYIANAVPGEVAGWIFLVRTRSPILGTQYFECVGTVDVNDYRTSSILGCVDFVLTDHNGTYLPSGTWDGSTLFVQGLVHKDGSFAGTLRFEET